MARGGEFLTSKERKEYMKLPNNVTSFETEKFFMLSDEDIKVINGVQPTKPTKPTLRNLVPKTFLIGTIL